MEPTNDNEVMAQISEMIGAMAALFPATQVGATTIRAYAHMLKDIPLVVLKPALEQCSVESRFLPSVAEIRDKATALTRPDTPPALEGWKLVTDAIQRYGRDRSVTAMNSIAAENPIAAEAARCLGWTELCNSENQVADRAHFSKVYDQLAARRRADERLLPAARALQLQSGQPVVAQLTEKG